MHDPLFSVDGQVVLVSGASRGIGAAIAEGFATRGARVIITGRERGTLDATAERLSAGAAHPVEAVVCDVADSGAIRAAVATVTAGHGHIDTLVNVAGVNKRQPAEGYTDEEYDFIFDVNLKGAFRMCVEAGRHMLARGAGVVINVDSVNTWAPLKHVTPYAMSKAGVNMMTRGLALEWGPRGVRVNGLAPGFIETDLTRPLWTDEGMRAWNRTVTPLQRLGTPADMAGTAVFLASGAAAFLTGQTLYVDGGVSAGINWPIDQIG